LCSREYNVSIGTVKLIRALLVLDPSVRLTASGVAEECRRIIAREQSLMIDSDLQVKKKLLYLPNEFHAF